MSQFKRVGFFFAAVLGILFFSIFGAQVGCGFGAPMAGQIVGGFVGMVGMIGCQQGYRRYSLEIERNAIQFSKSFQDVFGDFHVLLPVADSYLIREVGDGRVMLAVRDATGVLKILRVNCDVVYLKATEMHYNAPYAEFRWRSPASVPMNQPVDDYQWGIDNGMLVSVTVTGRPEDLRLGT